MARDRVAAGLARGAMVVFGVVVAGSSGCPAASSETGGGGAYDPSTDACAIFSGTDPLAVVGSSKVSSESGHVAMVRAIGSFEGARVAPGTPMPLLFSLPMAAYGRHYPDPVAVELTGTGALAGLESRPCNQAFGGVWSTLTPQTVGEAAVEVRLDGQLVDAFPFVVSEPNAIEIVLRSENRLEAVLRDAGGERVNVSDVLWQSVPPDAVDVTRGNLLLLSKWGPSRVATVFASFGALSAKRWLRFDIATGTWLPMER